MEGRRTAPRSSVARQVFTLQLVVVGALVVIATALAYVDARASLLSDARTRAVDIAQTVADSPAVVRALRTPDPMTRIQPFAEQVRRDTGTDFVVVMGLDRTRYSHPNPALLGKPFIGDLGGAPDGEVFTQEATGTLGPSMRSVVPVVDDDRVVALVSVGITLDKVSEAVWERVARLAVVAVGLLALGTAGAWLINRRLRRQTHGMGEQEITRMYEFYDAMLHAVREGLVLLDTDGRLQLANDEAVRLLGLPADWRDRTPAELGVPASLAGVLGDGRERDDEIHLVDDRVLLVSQGPATWDGRVLGSVVTLRDHTELTEVSGRLDTVQQLTDTLRAQTHEAANQLHTVVSLIELGRPEEAVGFATSQARAAQGLADRVHGVGEEPVLAAILLGKTGVASERGVELSIAEGSAVEGLPLEAGEIVTVVGNLLDNAFDAVAEQPERRVVLRIEADARWFALDVSDNGPGLDAEAAERAFERGWSTKPGESGVGRGLGLALVAQVVRRHGGTIEAGRSSMGGAVFSVRIGDEP
ncbi:sensor histidine kinase [Nocardioides sp. HDW12B]|uniref:sensor histidine kinase n=1 Tax=Nocardioides sp. HDW12B TaxID=2714939 RepID=UPI001981443F|nr:sensor histidine kinase [Nocardioides sp. HDW12B]